MNKLLVMAPLAVWGKTSTHKKNELSSDAVVDFMEGYADGLLNIYIRGQLEDCQKFVPHA